MKFTYNNKPDDCDCVAYIDDDGNLTIKAYGEATLVYLDGSSFITIWSESAAVHKFYKGDKLEIEF